jgi:hypothetical protein
MKVPTFTKQKFVEEDGNLAPPMDQMLDVFFQQAQENLSNDGFVIPAQTTDTINYILSPSNQNSKPDGTLLYDSQTNELKVRINGVVKVIATL